MVHLCGVPTVTVRSVSSPSRPPRDAPRSWYSNSPPSRGWGVSTVMLAAGPWRRKNVRPKQPKVEILRKGAKMGTQQETFLDASLGNDLEYKSIREVLFFKHMFDIFVQAQVEMSFTSKMFLCITSNMFYAYADT